VIIDLHTHCFPDDLASRAIKTLAKKASIRPNSDGTINGLKKSMKTAGITISFVQPIATKPEQTPTINKWAIESQEEGIRFFGTIHPDFPHWQDEIRVLKKAGIKGIKFHPDYQNFFVDEPRMFKIYERIFEAGLFILFHAGVDIGFPEPCHCPPQRLAKVLDFFSGAKIIAAHMGGYACWEEVERHLLGRDVYFDTSYSIKDLGYQRMTKLIKEHGVSKILFGTDSPWGEQVQEIEMLKALNLSHEELQRILSSNAQELLNLA